MSRLIRTKSDTLSLVLRCQYVEECWQMENRFAVEGAPEPPALEEREETEE